MNAEDKKELIVNIESLSQRIGCLTSAVEIKNMSEVRFWLGVSNDLISDLVKVIIGVNRCILEHIK